MLDAAALALLQHEFSLPFCSGSVPHRLNRSRDFDVPRWAELSKILVAEHRSPNPDIERPNVTCWACKWQATRIEGISKVSLIKLRQGIPERFLQPTLLSERQRVKRGLEALVDKALEALDIVQIDAEPLVLFSRHIAPEVGEPVAVHRHGSRGHQYSL